MHWAGGQSLGCQQCSTHANAQDLVPGALPALVGKGAFYGSRQLLLCTDGGKTEGPASGFQRHGPEQICHLKWALRQLGLVRQEWLSLQRRRLWRKYGKQRQCHVTTSCSSCTTLEFLPVLRGGWGGIGKVTAHTFFVNFSSWDAAGSKSNEMENEKC